ncbi:MAG: trypsin-like peptidase domain-containing protein [Planctomycetota bacterium]
MKRCSINVVLLSAFASFASVCGQAIELDSEIVAWEEQRIAAIGKAMPSAVSVYVPGGGGGGSGVLISPEGYALTNFHVTSPAGSSMICSLADGELYNAVIVGVDPVGDLAMIRLFGKDKEGNDYERNDFPYATFGNSLAAEAGDPCFIIGNPFLLAGNLQPTVTYGILSGVRRYQYPSGTLLEYGDCLQTDASVNPGNSGGPIYDGDGNLLGIVGRCSFEKRGRVNVGVGYAISLNQARNFLGYLRSGRILDHATLGATVTTDPDGGVVVSNILESSDAFRRGLRYGSEILEIDGRIVRTANELQNVLATYPAQWRVRLRFRDEGETRETLVRLSSVHQGDELLTKMQASIPPPPPRDEEPVPDGDEDEGGDGENGKGEDQKKGDDRDRTPRSPHGPHGHSMKAKPVAMPEIVKANLEERRGYANYFFNRGEQSRFIDQLRALGTPEMRSVASSGDSASEDWQWTVVGSTLPPIDAGEDVGEQESGKEVRIRIGGGRAAMSIGDRTLTADNRGDIFQAILARSVGGVTAAVDSWVRMHVLGPERFGETYHLGSMPLGGQRPLRPVTVAIYSDLETRFLMHSENGKLECIEVFADRGEDPVELWIGWKGADSDAPEGLPAWMDIRYGTESLLRFKVTAIEVEPFKESQEDAS